MSASDDDVVYFVERGLDLLRACRRDPLVDCHWRLSGFDCRLSRRLEWTAELHVRSQRMRWVYFASLPRFTANLNASEPSPGFSSDLVFLIAMNNEPSCVK